MILDKNLALGAIRNCKTYFCRIASDGEIKISVGEDSSPTKHIALVISEGHTLFSAIVSISLKFTVNRKLSMS